MVSLFGPYRAVLSQPGAMRFSMSALIARLPLSMVGLGIVLLVSALQGSYALAGLLTGAYVIASAIATPIGARYIDRWGQRRVVLIILAVHVPSLLLFVTSVLLAGPTFLLVVLAALAGSTQPATGSLVRARWIHAMDGSDRLRTAFAWESVLDEVIFVTGPPLATILAIVVAPAAPLVAAALLVLTGSLLLVSHRRSEPPIHTTVAHAGSTWRNPGVIGLTVVMIALGSVFGSLEIATVAVTASIGVPAAAGLILALYAGGSLFGGLVFGAWSPRAVAPFRQLFLGALILALVTLAFPFVTGVIPLSVVAVLAGVAVAPVLIVTNQLVSSVVPPAQLTEGLAWVNSTGLGAGVALSAAGTGALIDAFGARAGFLVTAGAGLVTILAVILFAGVLRSSTMSNPTSVTPDPPSITPGGGIFSDGPQ